MSADLQKGLRKVSEAQSAVISAEVTQAALEARLLAQAITDCGSSI